MINLIIKNKKVTCNKMKTETMKVDESLDHQLKGISFEGKSNGIGTFDYFKFWHIEPESPKDDSIYEGEIISREEELYRRNRDEFLRNCQKLKVKLLVGEGEFIEHKEAWSFPVCDWPPANTDMNILSRVLGDTAMFIKEENEVLLYNKNIIFKVDIRGYLFNKGNCRQLEFTSAKGSKYSLRVVDGKLCRFGYGKPYFEIRESESNMFLQEQACDINVDDFGIKEITLPKNYLKDKNLNFVIDNKLLSDEDEYLEQELNEERFDNQHDDLVRELFDLEKPEFSQQGNLSPNPFGWFRSVNFESNNDYFADWDKLYGDDKFITTVRQSKLKAYYETFDKKVIYLIQDGEIVRDKAGKIKCYRLVKIEDKKVKDFTIQEIKADTHEEWEREDFIELMTSRYKRLFIDDNECYEYSHQDSEDNFDKQTDVDYMSDLLSVQVESGLIDDLHSMKPIVGFPHMRSEFNDEALDSQKLRRNILDMDMIKLTFMRVGDYTELLEKTLSVSKTKDSSGEKKRYTYQDMYRDGFRAKGPTGLFIDYALWREHINYLTEVRNSNVVTLVRQQ
jgi:hypothetical protein